MLIKQFTEKVESVKRYRMAEGLEPARVAKALGVGYRIMVPLANGTETFVVKGDEVERLLAEFPGVTALWELFQRESSPAAAAAA